MLKLSRRLCVAVPLALATVVLAVVPSHAAGYTFHQTTIVQPTTDGEPGVRYDPVSNRLYAWTFDSNIRIFSSADGGNTWASTGGAPLGAGDADVAFDQAGNLYAAGLLDDSALNTTIPVSVSTDHGKTFGAPVRLDPSASGIAWDRQWIAASTPGHVVVTAKNGSDIDAWVSTDRGKTYAQPVPVTTNASETGPLIALPDGSFVMAYTSYDNATGDLLIDVATSRDGGKTWTSRVAAQQPDPQTGGDNFIFFNVSEHFPVVTRDSAGRLYVAYNVCDGLGVTVFRSCTVNAVTSSDAGTTWTKPARLSTAGHTAIFPWAVALGGGKADVVFFQANQSSGLPDPGPDLGGPETTWDVVMAQTLDGGSTWTPTVAAAGVHTGSICTGGLQFCPGPQQLGLGNVPTPFDRRLLDFFSVATGSDGNAVIVHPKDLPASSATQTLFSDFQILATRQTSGPTIADPVKPPPVHLKARPIQHKRHRHHKSHCRHKH